MKKFGLGFILGGLISLIASLAVSVFSWFVFLGWLQEQLEKYPEAVENIKNGIVDVIVGGFERLVYGKSQKPPTNINPLHHNVPHPASPTRPRIFDPKES